MCVQLDASSSPPVSLTSSSNSLLLCNRSFGVDAERDGDVKSYIAGLAYRRGVGERYASARLVLFGVPGVEVDFPDLSISFAFPAGDKSPALVSSEGLGAVAAFFAFLLGGKFSFVPSLSRLDSLPESVDSTDSERARSSGM